jgi:hypothetical protein
VDERKDRGAKKDATGFRTKVDCVFGKTASVVLLQEIIAM